MAHPFRSAAPARPAAYNKTRAITASAARLNFNSQAEVSALRQRATSQKWQKQAWTYYDEIGEIKFGFGILASVMSRLRLYAGVVVDPESPPVPVARGSYLEDQSAGAPEDESTDDSEDARRSAGIDPRLARDARDTLARAFRDTDIPTMLRQFTLNVSVPGECYLLQRNGRWSVRSTSELVVDTAGRVELRNSKVQGLQPEILPRTTAIGRIWRQHPEYSSDPDSSMRAILTDCEELILLGRMIRANARAQLNAGILYIPDEVSLAAKAHGDDGSAESEEEGDPLEDELLYTLTDPVNSENSAAAVVPLLLRGPAEMADKIKHILLQRNSDEFLIGRADRALERILQGVDVPKDIVTGLANVKYSNAIQIDENLYKAHVEPLAVMLCDALTEVVFRPLMRAAGHDPDDVAKLVVWYDPSEIVTRPDRAADADSGYDKNLLSGSAWRDAHGFSDTDAPDEEELAKKIALAATPPPEVITALYKVLLPEILKAARTMNTSGEPGAGAPLPPELQSILDGGEPVVAPDVGESSVPDGGPGGPA